MFRNVVKDPKGFERIDKMIYNRIGHNVFSDGEQVNANNPKAINLEPQ